MAVVLDCVVVGAGPAGLAASAALASRGVDHQLLDRGLAGQTWRSQRWDSFRLNTPGWMNPMLGDHPDDAYLSRAEMVRALDELGARAPLRSGVDVHGLDPDGSGFVLRTSEGPVVTRTVVVATGDQNVPRVPVLAPDLPSRIAQCHTAGYRRAADLPAGAVLVVGAGQSGCQIAADLLAAGRRVLVATSPVGRVQTPYRGREVLHWLVASGFYDQPVTEVTDPSALTTPNPLLAPEGRPLGLPSLARAGATLLGRPVGVDGERLGLDRSVSGNVAAGEAFATRVRGMVDAFITGTGADVPDAEPDPDAEPVVVDAVDEIDLRALGVSAVVWCTSFRGEFGWMSPGQVSGGLPLRTGLAGHVAGSWFIGMRWLTHRASSILYGFPRDAELVADAVRAHLAATART